MSNLAEGNRYIFSILYGTLVNIGLHATDPSLLNDKYFLTIQHEYDDPVAEHCHPLFVTYIDRYIWHITYYIKLTLMSITLSI